jgi:hypothetical protein
MWYCGKNRTLFVQIGKGWLNDPEDLWLFETTAYMYGNHVQSLTGITDAYDAVRYSGKAEYLELDRRHQLQKDCLFQGRLDLRPGRSAWPPRAPR